MLKAVIIDDENKSRRILSKLIEEYCPEVLLVGTANQAATGVELVKKTKPNIVFLDIEMPREDGFAFIEAFEDMDFEIVFTTAYEQYALKAFQAAAAGYLLKPIVIDELINIVNTIKSFLILENPNAPFGLIEVQTSLGKSKKLMLPIQYGITYLDWEKISFIESQGRKSVVSLIDGGKEVTTFNLKKCLELLQRESFIRVHKSYLINIRKIARYVKGKDGHIWMECGNRIDIGQFYKHDFLEALSFFIR